MTTSKKVVYLSLIFVFFIIVSTILHCVSFKFVTENLDNVLNVLSNIPKDKLSLLYFSKGVFQNQLNYYSIYLNYFVLFYGLFAILLAKFSFEERDRYLNFCYTIPKSRRKIFIIKLTKSLLTLIAVNLTIYIMNLIIFAILNNKLAPLFTIFLGLLIIQITIYSITLLVLSFRKKESLLVPIMILFVFVMLNIVYKSTNLVFLSYINPLSFFDYFELITTKRFDLSFFFAFVFITIFSISFSASEYGYGGKK